MSRTKIRPKSTPSRDSGIKPYMERQGTAFPNAMSRVTQTAKDWGVKEKHSEKLKPYLNPDLPYPAMDDFYPTPFAVESPFFPNGNWTNVNYGGEENWRFQCEISCRHTTRDQDRCTAPIKCTYGAWTIEDDGNPKGWQFLKQDGTDITKLLKIEWKPDAGRVGEIWATPISGVWGDIVDSDSERITAIFHDKGNNKGQYYDTNLKRWFQLVSGKSECNARTIVQCETCECPSGTFAFDADSTPDTISPSGTISIYVTGGCGPYSWSTSSTGYTFGSASTEGISNTLISASGT